MTDMQHQRVYRHACHLAENGDNALDPRQQHRSQQQVRVQNASRYAVVNGCLRTARYEDRHTGDHRTPKGQQKSQRTCNDL